jgi:chondroitin AC lyase
MRLAGQKLLSLKIHQRSRVEKLAKDLEDPENFAEVEGNRHFWKSDFMVHRRKNYYTSVKMSSYRVWGSESGNGEGLQNYHVGDGLNLLLVDGKEYEEIFPVWDWKRLPGVTCEQSPEKLPEIQNWGKTAQGNTAFVGGVTDGLYGTAVFDLSKDNVQGRKTWFFFENEYVALGTGISSKSPHPVYTSINQCLLQGEVTIRQGSQTTVLDEQNPAAENPRWVHHRRVGYFLPPQNSIRVRLSEQTGSWHAINQWASDQPERKKIFNLWLDHGIGPKEAEYSYVVVPDMELKAFEEYIANIPLRVLSNTPQLQAVYHKELGLLGAAFYEPGEIVITPQRKISVDQPCLIQMQWEPQRIHLAVSNPVNQALPVTVRLPDHYDAPEAVYLSQENVSEIHIPLPGDNLAGCSYIRWLEKHPS